MNAHQVKAYLEIATLVVGIAVTIGVWPRIRALLQRTSKAMAAFAEMPTAIGRLELVGAQAAIDISSVREDMSVMKQAFQVRLDSDPTLGYFECDIDGLNTLVNETYRGWVNASSEDLMGMGFLNYIPDDEREEIREEWALCLAERRIYRKRHHLVNLVTGEKFQVDTRAEPVPTHGPVKHWIGTIRKVVKGRRHDD